MANLREWMKAATVPEQAQLAKAVGSHRMSLYQYAAIGAKYHRKISAELAEKLEFAAEFMHRTTDGRLPLMPREDNADLCQRCPRLRCVGQTKD